MDNRTFLLLDTLFAPGYDPAAADGLFARGRLKAVTARQVPAGQVFLHGDFPADTVYFLAKGTARVVVGTPDGHEAVIDVVDAPHLFGVTEVLQGRKVYAASVAAHTHCLLARQGAEEFLHTLAHDLRASAILIRYLAWLATHNMDKSELKAIAPPRDILGRYLYFASVGRALPCTLRGTRRAISEELHINLRTLYRYLARFADEGLIRLIHGKIVIEAEGFASLEARYKDIID